MVCLRSGFVMRIVVWVIYLEMIWEALVGWWESAEVRRVWVFSFRFWERNVE